MKHFNIKAACIASTLIITACDEETIPELPAAAPSGNFTFINTVNTSQDDAPVTARSTFIYDENGLPLSQTDDIKGDGSELQIFTYNYENGRFTGLTFDNDGDGENSETLIQTTYLNNRLTQLTYSLQSVNSDFTSVIANMGYLNTTLEGHFGEHVLSGDFIADYSYNDDNRIQSRTLYLDGDISPTEIIQYTYHDNGKTASESIENDTDATIDELRSYREDGKLVQVTLYNNDATPTVKYTYSYSYYDNGLLESYTAIYAPDTQNNFTRDDYVYTPDGREWTRKHYTTSHQVTPLVTWTYVFADNSAGTGNIQSQTKVTDKGNDTPWTDSYSYEGTAVTRQRDQGSDGTANIVWYTDYNTAGQITESAIGNAVDNLTDVTLHTYDSNGNRQTTAHSNDGKSSFNETRSFSYEGNLDVLNRIKLPYSYKNLYQPPVEES